MKKAEMFDIWTEYLKPFKVEIQDIADKYPDLDYFTVDFQDLMKKSLVLSDALTRQPEDVISTGESAIQDLLEPDQKAGISLRFSRFLPSSKLRIKDLSARNIGHFVYLDDVSARIVSEKTKKLISGVFSCSSCGFRQEHPQESFAFVEPLYCPQEDGGCGKKAGVTNFIFHPTDSIWTDSQDIEVQDSHSLEAGAPGRVVVSIDTLSLCDLVQSGERIRVMGEHVLKQKKHGNSKSVFFNSFIKANNIEKLEQEDSLEITDEDLEAFKKIACDNPEVALIGSLAPHIEGYETIKLGIGLQLFCSPPGKPRKDFHILLAGDASTAKSELALAAGKLHPRCVYTTGAGSTDVGLTAALVDSPFGDGRKVLEAGAMVMADLGYLIIDEMDKTKDTQHGALYEALEQQTVTINKAGAKVTLHARSPVLGVVNPMGGKFEDGKLLSAQVKLPPPIFSRFALKFMIRDKVESKRDRQISDKVVSNHWDRANVQPIHPPALWKKYSKYAKSLKLTVDVEKIKGIISTFYVEMREKAQKMRFDGQNSPLPTARQLGDIINIAEAITRLHLDTQIRPEYIHSAVKVMESSWQESDDETYAGLPYEGLSKIPLILMLVTDHRDNAGLAKEDEIIELGKNHGISDPESIINKLVNDGRLYRPRHGFLGLI